MKLDDVMPYLNVGWKRLDEDERVVVGTGCFVGLLTSLAVAYGLATYKPSPPPVITVIRTEGSAPDIIHDAATGCEYLRSSYGVTVPRLGPDGRPICGLHDGAKP